MESLERFRIPHLPPSFYYIPNFITAEEEASILQKIPPNRWIPLTHRRLQAHPSPLTQNNTLLAAPLPPYLTTPILPRFKELGIFEHTPHKQPNHVLINEYKSGEGIMPHEDGPAYAHVVATISLGAAICLDITAKDSSSASTQNDDDSEEYTLPTRILQERGSLLVTTGPAYSRVLHGIEAIGVDEGLGRDSVANWELLGGEWVGGRNERGVRVSLTFRDVGRVSGVVGRVLGRR